MFTEKSCIRKAFQLEVFGQCNQKLSTGQLKVSKFDFSTRGIATNSGLGDGVQVQIGTFFKS